MTDSSGTDSYFPHGIQISYHHWRTLELETLSRNIRAHKIPQIQFFRQLSFKLNNSRSPTSPVVHAAELNLFASLQKTLRYLIIQVAEGGDRSLLINALESGGYDLQGENFKKTAQRFVELFPPKEVLLENVESNSWFAESLNNTYRVNQILCEILLLRLASLNPAIESFRELLDDSALALSSDYSEILDVMDESLKKEPVIAQKGVTLFEALISVIKASPDSLSGQIKYLRSVWHDVLPVELLLDVEMSLDILSEEQYERGGEPGPAPVLEFGFAEDQLPGNSSSAGNPVFQGFDYPAYEAFSSDADWMSNVVLMAKMVYVWLDQLTRSHGYEIARLDQVPDSELDKLALRGFTGLWLIGLWERSPASQHIKQICGNPEAIASAYSLYDYEVAADLGGWEALADLRDRAKKRGIRLASDMVPNHTGIYSRWVIQHPDWFVQTDYSPFPGYKFTGEDLSGDSNVSLQLEDGYWNKSDAAVVFKHYDKNSGRTRYIYHGNDGTSIPWNDTAQLNYLVPELRESVIQTILHVARNFPIIRFDAAMTLAKKHYQRLWFPLLGHGGGIPSRAEHGMSKDDFDTLFPLEFWREVVDRVAAEVPGTLLLAEAFWMMEGYFVRTLGMHRVYNSAFMNMLMTEENAKYRKTIKNVLEFNHEILKRFVNFMNNPDEKTAVAQFGSQGKYFGASVLLSTMPGLPMFGHGQIEGFHEKYGMEYKRAYWDEQVDEGLVRGHEMWIFPLLRKRWLFSGSENFMLYDFLAGENIDENVFAYSNRVDKNRALILFHNNHSKTSGWIKESVLFLAAGEVEGGRLERKLLADALLAGSGDDCYLVFRDQTGGLEYIRSVTELREKGLYVELKEYQFNVFMDFREICDDKHQTWKQLYHHLKGAGVESLEEERKQLMFKELNESFYLLFELFVKYRGLDCEALIGAELLSAIETFLKHGSGVNPDSKVCKNKNLIPDSFEFFYELMGHKTTVKDAKSFQIRLKTVFSDLFSDCVLLAFLVLREISVDPVESGLDYTLRKFISGGNLSGNSAHATSLLSALLEWWRSSDGTVTESSQKQMQRLFELEACKSFLLNHESGGVEWFNKERFVELYQWITLLNLLNERTISSSSRFISLKMGEAERDIISGLDMAQVIGYRSRLFVPQTQKRKAARTLNGKNRAVTIQKQSEKKRG
ncbi:MAG: alpha-amylase family glycosyl hydrolase [Desulfuromonadaceae bacterium]|nr:alpha-amylase family glycosyl hydrolase [Desulfuromonadaceae bacterium]MDD2855013.1 alpha-amylase family glycosyl hydrolase [Desulfuromonadaceae bacterium]